MSPPTSRKGRKPGKMGTERKREPRGSSGLEDTLSPPPAAPGRTRLRAMGTLLESPRNGRSGENAVKRDARRNDLGSRGMRTRRAPRSGVP